MPEPVLAAKNFSAGYDRALFSPANLSLEPGRLVSLVGPNGTGKSTILRCLAGLLEPRTGTVFLDGKPLEKWDARLRAQRVASVFTRERVPFGMSVREFVSLGRIPYSRLFDGRSRGDEAAIDDAISLVRMEAFATRDVSSLSDGERSRVFLARAIAQEPEALLLDEPTAYLDVPNILNLFRLLKKMAAERRLAVLLSTHHLHYAMKFSDGIVALDGKGRVKEDFPSGFSGSDFLEWADETI